MGSTSNPKPGHLFIVLFWPTLSLFLCNSAFPAVLNFFRIPT